MAGASGRPASILLIDDHAAIGAAMVVALQSEGFDPVVAVDAEDLSVEAVLGAARSMNPDIVLLDVNLGRGRAGLPMITPLTQWESGSCCSRPAAIRRPSPQGCVWARPPFSTRRCRSRRSWAR